MIPLVPVVILDSPYSVLIAVSKLSTSEDQVKVSNHVRNGEFEEIGKITE